VFGPGAKRYSREALQLFDWPLHARVEVLHIKLHHFHRPATYRVSHIHADCNLASGARVAALVLQVGINGTSSNSSHSRRDKAGLLGYTCRFCRGGCHSPSWAGTWSSPRGNVCTAAAWIIVSEKNLGDGGAFLLRVVRDMQNGGHVLLGPVDGDGKAGNQHHHGFGIGRVHCFTKRCPAPGRSTCGPWLPCHRSASGIGPPRAAGGMIADEHNRHVRLFAHSRRASSSLLAAYSKKPFHCASYCLDAIEGVIVYGGRCRCTNPAATLSAVGQSPRRLHRVRSAQQQPNS